MKLSLAFASDGSIHGDGIDDVGSFVIDGLFDRAKNQASWRKAYVGMHNVDYCGCFDRRTICGDWTLPGVTGAFWIWPNTLSESEKEVAREELDQPIEAIEAVV